MGGVRWMTHTGAHTDNRHCHLVMTHGTSLLYVKDHDSLKSNLNYLINILVVYQVTALTMMVTDY